MGRSSSRLIRSRTILWDLISCSLLSREVLVLVSLLAVLWSRNRTRSIARGNAERDIWLGGQNGFLDQTDLENKGFLVSWIVKVVCHLY